MPQYPDDFLYSDSGGAPPASPFLIPDQPGIGLTPSGTAPQPVRESDPRKEYLGRLSTGDRMATALQEFGAGMQGRESPLNKRVAQQQQAKVQKLQEFKISTDALEDGVKMARTLQGDARKSFIENYAKQLESVRPGLGDTYRSLSKQPDISEWVMQNAKEFPELEMAFKLDHSGKGVMDVVKSAEFQKRAVSVHDGKKLELILQKGQSFKTNWKQIVPPEMAAAFNKDGQLTASELMEGNEWIKTNKPDMKGLVISDEEMQVIRRNEDAFYGALGIIGPKGEADLMKERAKDKAESDIGKIRADEKAGRITKAEADARIAKLNKESGGFTDLANRNTELKLADDYARDTKGFKEIKVQFSTVTDYVSKVTADEKKSTSSGDRSLMFAYAKMNDPNDRVAVRDLQDIEKLSGVPNRVVQAAKNLAIGKELPPQIRIEMYQEIKRKFNEMNAQQHSTEKEYRSRAKRYELDERNIVQPYAVNMRDESGGGKPKVGETVSRGGKTWKVVGFDKDGEPLVDEVKR